VRPPRRNGLEVALRCWLAAIPWFDNTPTWETSLAGPFDRWANGLGFDYFYGFNAGDMNH